ncbi:MAG: hypothetical protein K8U57_11700 [Planctomycetes bacterium]|nr:hypothetical protein [Planctomycetota bacterium]
MDIPSLAEILAGIDNAIADFEETAPLATNENDRNILLASASDLRGIREQMAKEIPENLQLFKGFMEKMQLDGQQLLVDIEAQQAKVAAMAAAAATAAAAAVSSVPTPAVPEEAKIDLGLGAALRSDLLGKLFPEAKPADAFDPGKDIWQDWK